MLRLQVSDADDDSNGPPFTWEVLDVAGTTSYMPLESVFVLDQDGVIRLASSQLDHKVKKCNLSRPTNVSNSRSGRHL